MKVKIKRVIKYILFLGVIILLLNLVFSFFIINYSTSYPIGIYLKRSFKEIERGKLYVFCPIYNEYMQFAENNSFWNGINKSCGKTPLYLKKALGMPQDIIKINNEGVYINNQLIPNTEIFLKDKLFKNNIEFTLKENEYFMLSDYNKYSYDSRYFGIIKKHQIKNQVEPLLVSE